MAPRSLVWSMQKLCTLQGKVSGLQSPELIWISTELKYSRECQREEEGADPLLRLPLIPWHQLDFSLKLNHISAPHSFYIDGQPQRWNQKNGNKMYSIYYYFLKLLAMKTIIVMILSLQEITYYDSFSFFLSFLPPCLYCFFLPFSFLFFLPSCILLFLSINF